MKCIRKILYSSMTIIQFFFSLIPLNTKKIFCLNYAGKGFGDNCKYVVNKLNEDNSGFTVIWPVIGKTQKQDAPSNVRFIKYHSLAFLYHIATAKVWISNYRMPLYVRKRKNQFYIQMWHGSVALKKIEKDAINALDENYIQQAINDSKMTDAMISNGTFCTNMYKRAFWYDGKIYEFGSPRLDLIIQRSTQTESAVRKKIGISAQQKVALYAPTFRNDGNMKAYLSDFESIKGTLSKRFGGEWIILFRLHPGLRIKIELDERIVRNVTEYPDMYELMDIADFLITDYSSTMFEFGYVGKPVILFMEDKDEYIKDRNFYFDLKDLPYPIVGNNRETENVILNWDDEKYRVALRKFNMNLGIVEDGQASKRVVELIMQETYK